MPATTVAPIAIPALAPGEIEEPECADMNVAETMTAPGLKNEELPLLVVVGGIKTSRYAETSPL